MVGCELQLEETTFSRFLSQLRLSQFDNADDFLAHLLALQQLAWSALPNFNRDNDAGNKGIVWHDRSDRIESAEKVGKETNPSEDDNFSSHAHPADRDGFEVAKKIHLEMENKVLLLNFDHEEEDNFENENHVGNYEAAQKLPDVTEGSLEYIPSDFSNLTCNMCTPPKSFQKTSNLKRHLNFHRGGFKCIWCPKMFDRKERLESHELKHSRGQKPFPCATCHKSFTRKETLLKHSKLSHGYKPEIICNICKTKFDNKFQRSEHFTVMHPNGMFRCTEGSCTAQFKKSVSFHMHLSSCRSSDPKFKCEMPDCRKVFNNKSLLEQHKSKHQEPKLMCDHCGKKFRWLSSYKAHLRARDKKGGICIDNKDTPCRKRQPLDSLTKSEEMPLIASIAPKEGQQIKYQSCTRPNEIPTQNDPGMNTNVLRDGALWSTVDLKMTTEEDKLYKNQETATESQLIVDRDSFPQFFPTLDADSLRQ